MIPLQNLVGRDQFPEWLNANRITGHGVEVGTYLGTYAKQISETWAGSLLTVDPYNWQDDAGYIDGCKTDWLGRYSGGKDKGGPLDPEKVWAEATELLSVYKNCVMLRKTSLDAAVTIFDESLDFVYLDGNHGPAAILADIAAWWPKVRRGGIFAGHDFYDRISDAQLCGVATAIWNFSDKTGLRPHITHCSSWWFIKP